MSTIPTSAAEASPNYDNFARHYADQINRCTVLHAVDLIGLAEPQIRSAKRILEIGCGAGAFSLAYQQCFPHGIAGQSILCTDLSPAMVDVAKSVTEHTKTTVTDFAYQVADATKLSDFDDDSFDMVISVFGIFLIPDRAATLSELRRVLVNGGTLATSSWTTTEYNNELKDKGFGANLHDAATTMKVFPKGTRKEDRTPNSLPPLLLDWFDRGKIGTMLREQGRFSTVTVRRAIHSTTFTNLEHMWAAFTKSSPHFSSQLDQDPEQVALAKQALGDFVAPPGGQTDDPLFLLSVSNLILAS